MIYISCYPYIVIIIIIIIIIIAKYVILCKILDKFRIKKKASYLLQRFLLLITSETLSYQVVDYLKFVFQGLFSLDLCTTLQYINVILSIIVLLYFC